ncbi:MAG: alkaline phosphatase [Bacteroidaceae bacterium]|nr:alkaline phosphatase [Bacteroidaceae bacterium]
MDDFSHSEAFPVSITGSDKMRDAAISYIKEHKPGLAFFAWDYPDKTGHTVGWYTDDYMKELNHIDGIISSIVEACVQAGIIENTLFVITSDHGGHDKTHHQPLMSDLETPFMLFGKGIKPGEIQEPLMQYDVASIISDFLYLEKPVAWRGRTPNNLFN